MVKYGVIIYWSKEDKAFVAEVPELPGCMADGLTHQKALANVELAIQEWIETAKELGRRAAMCRRHGEGGLDGQED